MKQYSKASKHSTQSAFKNCASIHDRAFADLRHADLQKVIDDCPLKHSSLELIVVLFHQMYQYADIYGLVDKDHSAHVRINRPEDDEHGVPFSEDDIAKLWEDTDSPTAWMLLIMIYSGFRVSEFKDMVIGDGTMTGGVKTKAGKHRTVPIHHRIAPLISRRLVYDEHLISSPQVFRREMYAYLKKAGMAPHTPHDTRHTFSMLCERYGVSDHDRKRMMGHKIDDITAGTYGHRTIDDLIAEMLDALEGKEHRCEFDGIIVANLLPTVSNYIDSEQTKNSPESLILKVFEAVFLGLQHPMNLKNIYEILKSKNPVTLDFTGFVGFSINQFVASVLPITSI